MLGHKEFYLACMEYQALIWQLVVILDKVQEMSVPKK